MTALDDEACAIEKMAWDTVATFPEPLRDLARRVLIHVQDWPDPAFVRALQIDDPVELTGLYEGIPWPHKDVSDPAPLPDQVWLFRRPILHEAQERDLPLAVLVAHVTVHEFAHHFGWSDADIAAIDPWWED